VHKRHLLVASVLLMALTGCGVDSEALDVEHADHHDHSGQSTRELDSTDALLGTWRSPDGAYVQVIYANGTSTLTKGADRCWSGGQQVFRSLVLDHVDACGCRHYKGERNFLGACTGSVRWGPTTLKVEGTTLTETFVDLNDGQTKTTSWVR
jgi:hypothetical protein